MFGIEKLGIERGFARHEEEGLALAPAKRCVISRCRRLFPLWGGPAIANACASFAKPARRAVMTGFSKPRRSPAQPTEAREVTKAKGAGSLGII